MGWVIERAGADDLGAIMAIEQAVFADSAWSASTMLAELRSPHCFYLTAEDDSAPGQLVGYAGMFVGSGAEQADIQTIAVLPGHRGQGLGRALMERLVAEADARSVAETFLEVRADNDAARALYGSIGFAERGVRKGYYPPDGMDAIVMSRPSPARPAAASGEGQAG